MDPMEVLLNGQAEGAIPNGRRIRKVREEAGDGTAVGSLGTVLASHAAPREQEKLQPPGAPRVTYFYFVEWDWLRGQPVGVVDWKIEEVDGV